ncbi:MAG: peroxidase-related enzyme [Halobacteriales archaeon]|nr:peroxidase-related enzyme [Halobacteriales archaeon]
MAHLDYVDPDDVPPATRALLEADAETYGRPSLFARALAHNPAVLAARAEYTRSIAADGGLEPELLELATVAVSAANDCAYCVASHVERLIEGLAVPAEHARAVARGDYAALDERELAAVEFAQQLARDPEGVGTEGIEALREAGFDDAGIVALVTACATAVSANAIADALGIDPGDRGTPFAGSNGRE